MIDKPVLYTFRRCPYAMRARLALAISGIAYEPREITLKNKPLPMLLASPKGTVPVLVLIEGTVIEESLGIMQWALQQHDPEDWWRADRASQNDMLSLIADNDGPFKHHLDRYKYPNRFHAVTPNLSSETLASSEALIGFANDHRTEAALWVFRLNKRLQQTSAPQWLLGQKCSLADMAVLPFVRQFAHTDATWFAAQPWPAVVAWLARFEASPLFDQIMEKHPPWSG